MKTLHVDFPWPLPAVIDNALMKLSYWVYRLTGAVVTPEALIVGAVLLPVFCVLILLAVGLFRGAGGSGRPE